MFDLPHHVLSEVVDTFTAGKEMLGAGKFWDDLH